MADPKEDKIDFSKLEKQLSAAVEADASYWRENDAKIRAMEQRVESYDQFRDMVAASHIKPLDKKDKIGQSKRQQPWNPFSSSNSTITSSASQETQDGVYSSNTKVKAPKNGHEFTKEWRNRRKSHASCYSYMIDLGGETLAQIFRAEISFGLLGEMITTLNEDAKVNDCGKVAAILMCLTRAGRFGLSLDFLSKSEKGALSELVEKLERWRRADNRHGPDEVTLTEKEEETKTEDRREERLGGDGNKETKEAEGTGGITQQQCSQLCITEEDIVKLKELYKLLEK